jgi:hypothetical protein
MSVGELDRHVMFFPPEGRWYWVVVKSEERLAEERLAREVEAVKVNRSERRAHVRPAPVAGIPSLGSRIEDVNRAFMRRRLRETQGELFGFAPKDEVRPDGARR